MALEKLIGEVRALNQELPQTVNGLNQATAAIQQAAAAAESGSDTQFPTEVRAAAEAVDKANQSTIAAANAIAAIPQVESAEFRITADEGVTRLADLATDAEGVARRINSGTGGSPGGTFSSPQGVGGTRLGQPSGFGGLLNQLARGGGLIQPQPVPQGPAPPTQGERAIVQELRQLRDAIGKSVEAAGVSFRMGSKS